MSNVQKFSSYGYGKDDFEGHPSQIQNKNKRVRQQQSDQALNQIFADIIEVMMRADRDLIFHN